jgi:tripartite-type tricarboxylate transporter receptor subunit TctC
MKRLRSLLAALAALVACAAAAQDYPVKPVKLVVPYAPGGLPDTMARLVSQRMGESLGQQIVIENRPGAGGIGGTEYVAKSAPDGYILLIADVGQLAVNPHLYSKLPYDPLKDFAPVSLLGTSSLFLVAHPSVPVSNFAALVTYAKARPGQLNYGSSGTGSIHHLATEALLVAFGLQIIHVPYKGTGQSVPALLGGQVNLLYSALPSIEAQVKAGKLKLLAISTPKRSPLAPEVPTVIELGVPGYDFAPEIGLLAPAGTSSAIVARLAAEAHRALFHGDTMQRFSQFGIDPVGSSAEAYAAQIRAAYERYGRVVKSTGVKVE